MQSPAQSLIGQDTSDTQCPYQELGVVKTVIPWTPGLEPWPSSLWNLVEGQFFSFEVHEIILPPMQPHHPHTRDQQPKDTFGQMLEGLLQTHTARTNRTHCKQEAEEEVGLREIKLNLDFQFSQVADAKVRHWSSLVPRPHPPKEGCVAWVRG